MRLTSLLCAVALLSLTAGRPVQAAEAPLSSPGTATEASALPADLFAPAPDFKSACSASLTCGDGNTASCTGNNSCSVNLTAAVCDGVSHRCPNYCIVYAPCQCGGTLQCASNVGACSSGDQTVTCDNRTFNCPNFCL